MAQHSDILFTLVTILSAFISGAIGYNMKQKKARTDIAGGELDNMEKAIRIWRNLVEELEKDVRGLSDECNKLSEQVRLLRTENRELKQQVEILNKKTSHG